MLGGTTFRERTFPENVSGNIYVGGTTRDTYNTDKVIVVGEMKSILSKIYVSVQKQMIHVIWTYKIEKM